MVNQLLGISSENEVGEIAQLFSDFADGCLSVPVSLPGFAYHTAMNVIDETLRLGGIAIWLMREAKEDVEYQDYIIPRGSFVVPFLSAVHQDENFHEEAVIFNPCRWVDPKNQDKRNWRNSPFYSPFGGGARLCPGAELARLQIALFLHYFVTSYRWTQVKEDRMSFFPSARLARKNIIGKINKIIADTRRGDTSGGGLVRRLVEEGSLQDDAIADFVINLLFAGNETTAKTMLFAIYFLTNSPEAADQLLEEHQNIRNRRLNSKGEVDMITWEDYKSMSFTQNVIDETLRLGGIAIWLMREAKEDVEYQDYIIPRGSFVVPFLSAVHQDENFHEEAVIFNPCRWVDPKNQDKRNWRNSPFYSPFGGGARLCPGAELARLQIALFLHYFVTSYSFGTRVCNNTHGLRGIRKMRQGTLNLYVGNEMRASIEAIGSFDLIFRNGLIIVLVSCYYAPTITRCVVSLSRLVDNGFIHKFTDYGISVSKDNVNYFNYIPHDGIYKIDMHNLVPNVSSIYNVSNKRTKHNLDSTYPWHCCLGHINKKHIAKLQHDRLITSTDDESFDKCISCISGKMVHKPLPHEKERAKDILGLIHTDVCGPFRTMSREGASCFITFTDDFNRCDYEDQALLDMVRSMMNLTTLSISFWGYALESVSRIFNMVPTKKFEKTPYELRHGKALNLSYLKVTQRKPWVTTYYFCYPPENKIFVAPYAEFLKSGLISQEASRSKDHWEQMVFKKKTNTDGNVHTFKARLVAKGNNIPMLQDVKSWLGKYFAMKDSGEAAYILGIKIYIYRSKRLIDLSRSFYIDKILKRFKMENSKCRSIPMQERPKLSKSQGASTPEKERRVQGFLMPQL
uniref:Abietadienol/abietadienal oxidase n=1 Tax=Tanacetum cinerariifolium TaxID=118510 RepID=A0A6L2NL48_TANCI|nr:abietadienol/abietadienal oxidase [Tanacetum cinerariifolium]